MRKLLFLMALTGALLAQDNVLPKVKIKDQRNRQVSVQEIAGDKLTLLNFWATYCVPCRKEMPLLNALHEKYEDDNVQVVGIAIDDSRTVSRVKPLIKSLKLDYPVYLDTEQKLYKHFNTKAMPFSILVAPGGAVIWEHTGYVPGDEYEMEEQIKAFLADEIKE